MAGDGRTDGRMPGLVPDHFRRALDARSAMGVGEAAGLVDADRLGCTSG